MYISTDIPAGNGIVAGVDGDHITLKPDLRGNSAWWFYWHIAIRQAAGRTLHVHFDRVSIGPAGVAVSQDGGVSWHWSATETGDCAIITVPSECDDVRVSMTMPYTQAEWRRALERLGGLRQDVLCRSNGGREAPVVLVGVSPLQARAQVVITARHHCCETMASFAVEGFIEAWIADPKNSTSALVVVPFADMDGVEQGDQGKLRAPFDHNRSYQSDRYPETVAIRALVDGPERQHLPTYTLDLHCPYVRGNWNEHIYLVGSGITERASEQQRFTQILAAESGELLGFQASDLLQHGTEWNTASPLITNSCGTWFGARSQCRLAATVEIPYGLARGNLVTAETARAFGARLATALAAFIERDVP